MSNQIHIGNTPINSTKKSVSGAYTTIDKSRFYCISNVDAMPPFFMTLASSTDMWLFISSNGGLTAGRKNPDNALFPYATEDKIIATADQTGSKTIFKVNRNGKTLLWEPFSERFSGMYNTTNNLYKNTPGSQIIFEEINLDLELTFSYSWRFSDKFGFVKTATLKNNATKPVGIELLDGLLQVMPYGLDQHLQNNRSNLAHAYKQHELLESGLAVFGLSAMIVDRAEPAEALKATTVWATGITPKNILLTHKQFDAFRRNQPLITENFEKGIPGSYLVHAELMLESEDTKDWMLVVEGSQSIPQVKALKQFLSGSKNIRSEIEADIMKGDHKIKQLVGKSDGLQLTSNELAMSRHFTNTLFNIMRGGVFESAYQIDLSDFQAFIQVHNLELLQLHADFFGNLPGTFSTNYLNEKAAQTSDPDLIRLCKEYLPLSFSRRHGDPSRPWNYFNIQHENKSGQKAYNYEGNWRDIFQNWEPLAYAFPHFIEGMITRFLNASTIDGYNPYRIMRAGIDWEVVEEHDPWSYIGYWGDHQIIYLQKLFEHLEVHFPGALEKLWNDPQFVFANVPYRIASYAEMAKDPRNTISFDHDLDALIAERVKAQGADGKLVIKEGGGLLRAGLGEKLLISVLTKLYNYIPEAGIWMNTQRPEWNDANNALVGNGVSMVTLCYLRRMLVFLKDTMTSSATNQLQAHKPVAQLFSRISEVFSTAASQLPHGIDNSRRKAIMDALGYAGEAYRNEAYSGFSEELTKIGHAEMLELFSNAIVLFDHDIAHNQRPDKLYHAYNLVTLKPNSAEIQRLYEMLEGQVAALSAKTLSPNQALELLDALKRSALFRPDQYSYLLYPNRSLPRFLEKNTIAPELLKDSELVQQLLHDPNNPIIEQGPDGQLHFAGHLQNAKDLEQALNKLWDTPLAPLVARDQALLLQIFESVFNHAAFTGRSGTFYGYEGLGCIYWHMVSKLLLAVQENIYAAEALDAGAEVIGRLKEHYYEIRAGIGINKSPHLYGAFPTDAYSHTPMHAGAQQPGLTGQVKEDILNRWAELGIQIEKGCLNFKTTLLDPKELLSEALNFEFVDVFGHFKQVTIAKGAMGFTYLGVPIIYQMGPKERIEIELSDATTITEYQLKLSRKWSESLFARSGAIQCIRVWFK